MAETTQQPDASQREARPQPPVPVNVLAFSVLSLLIEAAAAHLGASLPGIAKPDGSDEKRADLSEARLAIDAADALFGAIKASLTNDERIAIEGLLTQIQVEFIKRTSARA